MALHRVLYFRFLLHRLPFNQLLERANEISDKNFKLVRKNQLPIGKIAWAVKRAGRLVPGATCLVHSLAGKVLFAGEGYETIIKIGVVREKWGGIASHAWLLFQNDIVVGQLEDLEKFSLIL